MKQNNLNLENICPNALITKRDILIAEIRRYWHVIGSENIVRKGTPRSYDLKSLLTYITTLSDDLVVVKLKIQCANMGIKFSDLPANANIINIYKLSALRDFYVQLDALKKDGKTINPVVKAKYGKKRLTITEEITRSYVSYKQKEIDLKCNELLKRIDNFNNTLMSTPDKSVSSLLTA